MMSRCFFSVKSGNNRSDKELELLLAEEKSLMIATLEAVGGRRWSNLSVLFSLGRKEVGVVWLWWRYRMAR